jgi:hypothetical protein
MKSGRSSLHVDALHRVRLHDEREVDVATRAHDLEALELVHHGLALVRGRERVAVQRDDHVVRDLPRATQQIHVSGMEAVRTLPPT